MYEQSPWIVFAYPDYFEAYNTQKWTGWTRVNNGNGPAFYTAGNVDTYLNLAPSAAKAATSSAGRTTVWIVVVGAGAIAVVLLILWRRRRTNAAVEE